MNDYKALTEVARARYKLACDEMDRLTKGSPGNNWRWSIPANPDRDSDLILSASAEDVPKLADAVEALQAERDALRDSFQEAEQIHERVVQRLVAERDEALKALGESRARFADSETKRAELEAVIRRADGLLSHASEQSDQYVRTARDALNAFPSVVLQDRDRGVRADELCAWADWIETASGTVSPRGVSPFDLGTVVRAMRSGQRPFGTQGRAGDNT